MNALTAAIQRTRAAAEQRVQQEREDMIADMEAANAKGWDFGHAWRREAGCMLRAVGIDCPEEPSTDEVRVAINAWRG